MRILTLSISFVAIDLLRSLLFLMLIACLFAINFFLIRLKSKKRFAQLIAFNELMDIIGCFQIPIAVFTRKGLLICYVNRDFAKFLGREIIKGTPARELFTEEKQLLLLALQKVSSYERQTTTVKIQEGGEMVTFKEAFIEVVEKQPEFIVIHLHEVKHFQAENELLKSQAKADRTNISLMNEELLLLGEELEITYGNLDDAKWRLMDVLEVVPEILIEGVGYWSYNFQKNTVSISGDAWMVFNISSDDPVLPETIRTLIDQYQEGAYDRIISTMLSTKKRYRYEFKVLIGNTSEEIWLKNSGKLICDDTGNPQIFQNIIIMK